MFKTWIALLLIALLSGLTACRTAPTEREAALAQMVYPKDAPIAGDLDIVVERKGGRLRLINRTASEYANKHLWLNQQYVSSIDHIEIGNGNRFNLRRFINQHAERFPVGGFLTPDRARPVVLAELFDPETGQRHRLLVRR